MFRLAIKQIKKPDFYKKNIDKCYKMNLKVHQWIYDFINANIILMTSTSFGKKTVIALTGVSGRQLEHWATTGIVRPSIRAGAGKGSRREYSFKDLVALKVAKRLRDEGISLQKIRKSLAWLRRHFPEVTAPLAELRFLTNGVDLFVLDRDPAKILDSLKNGQLLIALALGELIEDLKGDLKNLAIPEEVKVIIGKQEFTVVLTPEPEGEGYAARCREIPTLVSRGETEQEALDAMLTSLDQFVKTINSYSQSLQDQASDNGRRGGPRAHGEDGH